MKKVLLGLIILFSLSSIYAGSNYQAEIDHLLNYVKSSGCTFIRNGSEYTSVEACDHMKMKYSKASSKVKSAEDFIKYVATRSYMTGELYYVKLKSGERITSESFLKKELKRYREDRR